MATAYRSMAARPVTDVPVLEAGDCQRIHATLERLRPHWVWRGRGFATLGVAAYLDAARSKDPERTYHGQLVQGNRRLQEQFGDTLDRVAATLAELLAAPTRFLPELALPGFHVFEGPGIATSGAAPHFDLQHLALRWPDGTDLRERISFTLAVKLPAAGGALEHWHVTERDLRRLSRLGRPVSTAVLGRLLPARRHAYREGWMAVQQAPVMHRIAPVPTRRPGDQRITLQGHGVRHRSGWILYW